MISTIISVIFGIIMLCPFIATFLVLVIYKRMGKAPITVLGPAADFTTPLLFLSVYFISRTIFDFAVGFYIALTAMLVIIIFTIYEWKNTKEFRIMRLLRKVWRLFFLILTSVYILLVIGGTVLTIIKYLQ